MQFTLGEMIEIEEALGEHNPSEDDDILDAHRAYWKVAKALKRPWTERFTNADDAAKYHLEALKKGTDRGS